MSFPFKVCLRTLKMVGTQAAAKPPAAPQLLPAGGAAAGAQAVVQLPRRTLVVAGEVVHLLGRSNSELALLLALAHASASRRLRARAIARNREHAPQPPTADPAQRFLPGWD